MRRPLILIFLVLIFLAAAVVIFDKLYSYPKKIDYGVTFSPKYAGYLKLDWQRVYTQILDDLQVKNLRIPTYWDDLQKEPQNYDFSQTDYLLAEAGKRNARVILVLGARQPRWPECYIPSWAKSLSVSDRQQKILEFVQKVVERYKQSLPSPDGERKDSPIIAWQVENEPLLGSFGEGCDAPDKDFLKKEVELVRSLSSKTIIIADSGELGSWVTSMQLSDVFGTTLYRKVYSKLFGYRTYPLPPSFYTLKSNLVRNIFAQSNEKTIIVELQAEPWLADGIFIPAEQQAQIFALEDLKSNINFSQKTGFDEVYLWGVEWWYFMAEHGHPQYLEYAKTLFR